MSSRILIVEDERAIQVALRGLLRREGYEVELADTGGEAPAILRELGYDESEIERSTRSSSSRATLAYSMLSAAVGSSPIC